MATLAICGSEFIKKDTSVRLVDQFLPGDPERPLFEAVTVKPELHWRHQVVENAKKLGYLPRLLQTSYGTSPRERNALQLGNQEGKGHLSKDVGICPAGFQSCFALDFPHCSPSSLLE